MSRERARGVARILAEIEEGVGSLRNTERERETMAKGLGDLSSILNPSLFISPFTVDAKTA